MRKPAVSGTFYPSSKDGLIDFIEGIIKPDLKNASIVISPHAGIRYSGKVAGKAISCLKEADTYIIIGPDHHGRGAALSLSRENWKTPLGDVEVDTDIGDQLMDIAVYDSIAHEQEHSIEVQIPFLQYYHEDFSILPISMGLQDKETVVEIADKLVDILENNDVALVCSSDFTHYESKSSAQKKDKKAIDQILKQDTTEFYKTIRKENISICGYGPIATAMEIAKAKKMQGNLIEYTTSAETTGDETQVVGYAAIAFK
ncbi:putative class III extradiol dioxygenase MEMO1 family [Methanonatronarchaeum thermophilum]|uniref:MEMO1 family protein AMET1_0626 n=1 Tax=Methanonatronarchaeum thermophilum TaxID=1927129 RepID=A0A1Y3GHR3_9EURY|nr:MEMO1 family protein [Methanonatronarchaeum thermophilum]OUJ18975.1 putative class III extradiol dioxygenase MEMO1 family [Methanonatronarchaeum thermophilum]